jgi:hypothetical protein
MSQKNLLSFNIPEADMTEILTCIKTLQEKLMPHLLKLTPEERQELLKMGDKTLAFVLKSAEHCKTNPDLVPPYVDVNELAIDIAAYESLRAIHQPLLQITNALSDTMSVSGSEALSACLMFYSSVKNATRSTNQKAETIYRDLAERFPGRGKSRKEQPAVGA